MAKTPSKRTRDGNMIMQLWRLVQWGVKHCRHVLVQQAIFYSKCLWALVAYRFTLINQISRLAVIWPIQSTISLLLAVEGAINVVEQPRIQLPVLATK